MPLEALGNLSHDLSNALSVILTSATSLIRREPPDQTARRQIELVHRSALRIHALTDELNDAVAIGSGQLELKLAPLEIGQVLREAVETARERAPKRNLCFSGGGDDSLWIRGDRLRLQRLFAHLLRSALAGSLDGAVEVTIERRGAEACIKIADGGMAQASASPASEDSPFHPSTAQRLSLARFVSHGVAVAHGGRLWLEGQGTVFLVSLPLVSR